ncbi:MAG: hypothetical protein MAG451_01743 [Anaerolineales bacterium]|nr:hypothetical protein [Anaerolineales bacterium]
MRRFVIGMVVGFAAGWVAAWWRLSQVEPSGLVETGQEPMRIALPDMPWGGDGGEAVPVPEPVAEEAAESTEGAAEDVVALARKALEGPEPLRGYCARCRAKRPIQDPEPTATKDGRPAVRGTCPECDANMFRFVSY